MLETYLTYQIKLYYLSTLRFYPAYLFQHRKAEAYLLSLH